LLPSLLLLLLLLLAPWLLLCLPGYGVCSGQPSIAATCCDISAVLQSLEADHGIKRHTVVMYGQSVGSGPTVSSCRG
jgi:hypothetical protein